MKHTNPSKKNKTQSLFTQLSSLSIIYTACLILIAAVNIPGFFFFIKQSMLPKYKRGANQICGSVYRYCPSLVDQKSRIQIFQLEDWNSNPKESFPMFPCSCLLQGCSDSTSLHSKLEFRSRLLAGDHLLKVKTKQPQNIQPLFLPRVKAGENPSLMTLTQNKCKPA